MTNEAEVRRSSPAETNGQADVGDRFRIVTLEEFVAVDEPGAKALVGDDDDAALIAENADVMLYGDGGTGKTTLSIDLACHLAAGDAWLGIPVARATRVLIVENEGQRGSFRTKLRRKRDAWAGSPLDDRISVLEEPWGSFSFADAKWREDIAGAVREHNVGVLIVGPVSRSGMDEAGTLQDVGLFADLLREVREQAGHPLVVVLIHHENKGGKVSGAWEGAGDTLFHVQGQGHGRTRLYIQKARGASKYHQTSLNLVWAEGDGFAVEEKQELDDDAIADAIRAYVREHAGTGWVKVERAVTGVRAEKTRAVRDRLLADGELVNVVNDEALSELQERKPAHLYLSDDPTIGHVVEGRDTAGTQLEAPWAAEGAAASVSCVLPYKGRRDIDTAASPPVEQANGRTPPTT